MVQHFKKHFLFQYGLLIGIISISSLVLIYNIFNISISKKKKYIASLSSIGATKKQIFKIYFIEVLIIALIAIPIGILINFILDYCLINYLDNIINSIQGNLLGTFLHSNANVDLYMVYSPFTLLLSIVLIFIIVVVSIFKPIFNSSKTTIIDLIRQTKYNRINNKLIKTPKYISKLFNITGELAYKNIKRNPSTYISIIFSLTISIILFISVNGYVSDLNSYNTFDNLDYNYSFHISNTYNDTNYNNEIINILNQLQLIDSIYGIQSKQFYTILEGSYINDSLNNAINKVEKLDNITGKSKYNSVQLLTSITILEDNTYEEYLNKLGNNINLNENECILVNYSNYKTKYYDGVYLTNYKANDTIVLTKTDRNDDMASELSKIFNSLILKNNIDITNNNTNQDIKLKIKEVTNIIPKGVHQNFYLGNTLYLIVNKDTFKNISGYDINYEYFIQTSNPDKLDNIIDKLNEKGNYDKFHIFNNNLSLSQQSDKNEIIIKKILLYTFTVLIFILTIINVFNVILSSMISRKDEFSRLIAFGMSRKQLNKMLFLEGFFYGIVSLTLGFIIGIIILYILYINLMDTILYPFVIPYNTMILVIILVYTVIFTSIKFSKNQLKIDIKDFK